MTATENPLMGAAEIAQMLGVSRQRVQQLIAQPDFPKPYSELAMGKAWRRTKVIAWAKAHGREVGD